MILAIYDRETARMREENRRIEAASRRGDLHGRALVEALVHELAAGVLGNADTLRVFMHRAVVDQNFWERGSKGLRDLSATFEGALGAHRDEIRHPDPDLAIDMAFRLVYDTLARRISHGPDFESDRLSQGRTRKRARARGADYLIGPSRPDAQPATGAGRFRSASSISASWLRMCFGVS